MQLANLRLAAKVARSQSDLDTATQKVNSEFLRSANFGAAASDLDALRQQTRDFNSQEASLAVESLISGVVLTLRCLDKLVGQAVAAVFTLTPALIPGFPALAGFTVPVAAAPVAGLEVTMAFFVVFRELIKD